MGGFTPLNTVPGTVLPQQQQQGATPTGEDLLKQLASQRQALDSQISQIISKGLSPTNQGSAGTSPALTMNPVQQQQSVPRDMRQVSGGSAGKNQAIYNTLAAAGSIVGQFEQKEQQEKQRRLAVDIERVFQSVQGIQQAQDALKADPNNTDAKTAMQKDQAIIDSMLSDPKKRKQIAKALDISFVDPESNNGPEHKALKQATASFSQQLMNKIPQGMGINPQMLQRLQLLQAQKESIDKLTGQLAPTLIREQGAADRQQVHETSENTRAQFHEDNENARAQSKIAADAAKAQQEIQARYQTAMAVAKTREDALMARQQLAGDQAFARLTAGLQMREHLIQTRKLTPQNQIAAYQRSYQISTAAGNQLAQQINQWKTLRDQLKKQEPENPQIEKYNQMIHNAEDKSSQLSNFQNDIMDKIKKLQLGGVDGQPASSSSTGTSKSSDQKQNTVGTSADSDPDDDSDLYGINDDNKEE